jgi:hypothetical protein
VDIFFVLQRLIKGADYNILGFLDCNFALGFLRPFLAVMKLGDVTEFEACAASFGDEGRAHLKLYGERMEIIE